MIFSRLKESSEVYHYFPHKYDQTFLVQDLVFPQTTTENPSIASVRGLHGPGSGPRPVPGPVDERCFFQRAGPANENRFFQRAGPEKSGPFRPLIPIYR